MKEREISATPISVCIESERVRLKLLHAILSLIEANGKQFEWPQSKQRQRQQQVAKKERTKRSRLILLLKVVYIILTTCM